VYSDGIFEMKWNYFIGACVVVGGALLKSGAPVLAIVGGMALAGLANYLRQRSLATRGSAAAKSR
jgi:hypothetical protein